MPKTKKPRTLQNKVVTRFNKFIMMISSVVVAGVGVYFLVFSQAKANNCSPIEGGAICDVNQASDGMDSVFSMGDEADVLASKGWWKWDVGFRAPNFAQNGATPLWRFNIKNISQHVLALEGTPLFNDLNAKYNADIANNTHNVEREGNVGFAWPDGRQSGTVPIHIVNRKPWYFLTLYSDNKQFIDNFVSTTDGTYEYGGTQFWAYPANYFPPKPASTPTKDTDCANQNLSTGDKGACVQSHKKVLNGYGAKLDTNNNLFDAATNDNTRLFVIALKSRGVKVSDYGGVVTKEIWDALAKGYPATPSTPATPAAPTAPKSTSASQGSGTGNGNGGTTATSNSVASDQECYSNLLEMARSEGKWRDGKRLSPNCILWWQKYAGVQPADKVWGPKTKNALLQLAGTGLAGLAPASSGSGPTSAKSAGSSGSGSCPAGKIAYTEGRCMSALEVIAEQMAESKAGTNLTSINRRLSLGSRYVPALKAASETAEMKGAYSLKGYCSVIVYAEYWVEASTSSKNYWTYPDSACHKSKNGSVISINLPQIGGISNFGSYYRSNRETMQKTFNAAGTAIELGVTTNSVNVALNAARYNIQPSDRAIRLSAK